MSFKIRDAFLPYNRPDISQREIDEVIDTLGSGWLVKGPRTMKFEEEFAAYLGAKYAVGMNSCTAALHISLLCAGIGEGDEVITTPMTFVSSVNTIIHAGAKPVLVDIDQDTACIDPKKITAAITKKTKAIVPVHYAGQACDLDKIYKIADEHNLFVSEDAAHAFYTRNNGKLIGNDPKGTVSYSFYATKNLCTGEGGMLVTNDEAIAKKARCMVTHGMSDNAWKRYAQGGKWGYDVTEIGYKYNMFDMQAALGLVQLSRFEQMQQQREKYARIYDKEFDKIDGIDYIKISPNTTVHSRHLYIIKIDKYKLKMNRDEFIFQLNERKVGTSVHFIPVHYMSIYKDKLGFKQGDFPVCENYFDQIISLPLYSTMTENDVYYVIEAIRDIIK